MEKKAKEQRKKRERESAFTEKCPTRAFPSEKRGILGF